MGVFNTPMDRRVVIPFLRTSRPFNWGEQDHQIRVGSVDRHHSICWMDQHWLEGWNCGPTQKVGPSEPGTQGLIPLPPDTHLAYIMDTWLDVPSSKSHKGWKTNWTAKVLKHADGLATPRGNPREQRRSLPMKNTPRGILDG